MSTIQDVVQAGRARVREAAAGPFIGPRSDLVSHVPSWNGVDQSISWERNIGGVPHSFQRIIMRNGEVRFFVSRYNGYPGGTAWGCAWDQTHAITIPNGDMVQLFGRPISRARARAMGAIDPQTGELYS